MGLHHLDPIMHPGYAAPFWRVTSPPGCRPSSCCSGASDGGWSQGDKVCLTRMNPSPPHTITTTHLEQKVTQKFTPPAILADVHRSGSASADLALQRQGSPGRTPSSRCWLRGAANASVSCTRPAASKARLKKLDSTSHAALAGSAGLERRADIATPIYHANFRSVGCTTPTEPDRARQTDSQGSILGVSIQYNTSSSTMSSSTFGSPQPGMAGEPGIPMGGNPGLHGEAGSRVTRLHRPNPYLVLAPCTWERSGTLHS